MRYAKYKPTGIAWLPEVPEGWEMVRNKTFLTITDEKVGERKDEFTLLSLTKQGVIVRDLSEMKGKFPKDFDAYLVVRPSNLVFCLFDVDETPRTVGLVRNVGMLTGAYTNFKVDNDLVLPEFACYYYLHVDDAKKLRPYYTGLRKVVKTNTFLQLRFPRPPLNEQRAIVAYIDEKCGKIDRLVAAKEKEAALLKELKQSMIAEAVTRGISHAESAECVEGVSSPRSLRSPRENNRRLVPSGIPWLPEVPEGWEMKRLKWILEEIKVLSTTGEELPLSLTATDGLIPFSEKANRTMESATYVGAKIVRKGQIVFNRFKARLFAVAPCTGLVSSDYAVYQVRIEVEKKFLLYLFATPTFRQVMNNQASGIGDGFSRLYSSELFKLYVPLPPLVEQREIVAHIEARAAKIDAAVKGLEREVAALKEYKQRLIADVVTGQRKVA